MITAGEIIYGNKKKVFIVLSIYIFSSMEISNAFDLNLPICEKLNILGFNSIKRVEYEKNSSNEIGIKLIKTSLVYDWSNSTDNIQEIFFKNLNNNIQFNKAEVIYEKVKEKKIVNKKIFSLIKEGKNFYKIDGFYFPDEIRPKKDRPGIQYFILKNNDKKNLLRKDKSLPFNRGNLTNKY